MSLTRPCFLPLKQQAPSQGHPEPFESLNEEAVQQSISLLLHIPPCADAQFYFPPIALSVPLCQLELNSCRKDLKSFSHSRMLSESFSTSVAKVINFFSSFFNGGSPLVVVVRVSNLCLIT
eukprot:c29376_g2_i3 orf=241-603(-)